MGVYIKNMEMPTSCHECVAGYGGCCYIAPAEADGICPDHGRADFCPLVPVPPHGRLIDADAYGEILRGLGSRDYRREKGTICDAIKMLQPHYAPTIIPAETAEEGET